VLAEGSVGSGIFGDEFSCVNLVDLRGRFPGESKLDGGAVLATVVVQAKGVGDYQLVRALVDSGSNRFSFISPSGLKRLGLVDCTRKWTARHTVGGAQSVTSDKCVDVLFQFGDADSEVAVTLGVMELPVEILLGMDILLQLGAKLDLPGGTLFFSELGVMCDLERQDGRSSAMEVLLALGVKQGAHEFQAEVARLEALPDVSEDVAAETLRKLLREFEQLFGPPVRAEVPPVRVSLKEECIGRSPINIPPRRRAQVDSDRIERHIAKEVKSGFIGPSQSGWNFQTVLAKKEGDPEGRLCIDFGPLSPWLRDDYRFSIPRHRDLFDRVRGKKVFSKLDLRAGFKQFALDETSRDILSFTGPDGRKWRFLVMPFGIKFASEVFQAGMQQIIGPDLLWTLVQLYIDDCLEATATRRAHLFVLRKLLERFDQHDVRLASDKCVFMQARIEWIGRVLDENGVAPCPNKLAAIRKIPLPSSKDALRKYMCMAQWHIKDFSPAFVRHASKLWPFTSTKQVVRWQPGPVEIAAFEAIRDLTGAQLLRNHFKDHVPSALVLDSSDGDSICAMLMQEGRMVDVASRTLSPTERKWAIIEKEMLAIKYGCEKFRSWIFGRKTVVWTDHDPLIGLLQKDSTEIASERLLKMRLFISEFDLDLRHIPGELNPADFWTRLGLGPETDDEVLAVQSSQVAWMEPYSQADLRELKEFDEVRVVAMGREVRVQGKWKLFVPARKRRALCWALHRERHMGVAGMMDLLLPYHWIGKQESVGEFVAGCACAVAKEGRRPKVDYKRKLIRVEMPLGLVAIDVFNYDDVDYLTIMDMASGFPWIYALPEGHTQTEVLDKFEQFESAVGTPGRLLSDRGVEFDLITAIPRSKTAAFHPEGNALLERFHKELANLSRAHALTPVQAITKYRTPEMRRLFTGRPPVEAQDIDYGPDDEEVRSLAVGDVVARFIPRRSRTKACDVWSTPMRVVRKIGDRSYSVFTGARRVTVSINDLKKVAIPSGIGWSVRAALLEQFLLERQVDAKSLVAPDSFPEAMRLLWVGKRVLLPVAFKEVPAVMRKLTRDRPEFLIFVVPHLAAEQWFQVLSKATAHWVRLPGKGDDLKDCFGDPVGRFCFDLWLIQLFPE